MPVAVSTQDRNRAFRDNMQRPRLQSDVNELDRMAEMADRAVGIVMVRHGNGTRTRAGTSDIDFQYRVVARSS